MKARSFFPFRPLNLLLISWISVLTARGETLYFIAQSSPPCATQGTNFNWASGCNWFSRQPDGTFTQANRVPGAADTAWTLTNANASLAGNIQLAGLIVGSTTIISGGNFDVGAIRMAPEGVASNNPAHGFSGSTIRVRTSIDFVGAGPTFTGTNFILEPGAFAIYTANQNGTRPFANFSNNSTLFIQGSWVMSNNAALGVDATSRIDVKPGADIRGSGTTHLAGGQPPGAPINLEGTIRCDSGAMLIDGLFQWQSLDGSGSFNANTADAIINIQTLLRVPANVTYTVRGAGVVATMARLDVLGTFSIGIVDSASGVVDAGTWEHGFASGQTGGLSGSGTIRTVSDAARPSTINWTAGSMLAEFTGKIDVDPRGILNLIGAGRGASLAFGSGTINNAGTATASMTAPGGMTFGNNAVFNNLAGALFDSKNDHSFVAAIGSAAQFNNAGTYRKSGGDGLGGFGPTNGAVGDSPIFTNTGRVEVKRGALQMMRGSSSGAVFAIDAGVALQFATRTFTLNAGTLFEGNDGQVRVARAVGTTPNGILMVNSNVSVPNLFLENSGAIDGPGTLTVTRSFEWTGGTLQGTGGFTLAAGATGTVIGSAPKTLVRRVFNNSGTLTWSGPGNIDCSDAAVFNNLADGLFDVRNDAFMTGTLADTPTFNNSGVFRKSQGTGVTRIGINFNNRGLIDLLAGTTSFYNFIQQSGTTRLAGGNLSNQGFGTPLVFDGGSVVGSGTITGTVINNGATIAPGLSPGLLTINGDYTQGGNATLAIEIAGITTPGTDYDQLAISGSAMLDGELKVTNINGFVPGGSDTVTPLTARTVSGVFARTNAQVNYQSDRLVVAALPSSAGQLLNISTRLRVLTGENVLIGGFIITGTEPKQVIIRAIGPSLTSKGVSGALQDPTLDLFDGAGDPITSNDNWKDTQQSDIEASQIPPTHDAESAIVRTLPPGNYTAIVRGKNASTGIGLVEVYDLGQRAQSKLANISSRGFVDTGDNVMIGGLIIGGSGTGSARVVVRALGPSLGSRGISGALDDPTLELTSADGTVVRANDNWKESQQAELETLRIQPNNDAEAALIETLAPGNYTAIVRGKNSSTGVALVEVYNVE